MHRELVVEAEAHAAMAHLDGTAVVLDPAGLRRCHAGRGAPACDVHRMQGVSRQDVLDVHQQELLMLLLVMQAERDELDEPRLCGIPEHRLHRGVHRGAVARDVVDARSGEEPAFGAWMPGADRLVVRVEDVLVRIVECGIPRGVLTEDERLEEPGDVSPVPLGRAHVGHRLHRLVLRARVPTRGAPWSHGRRRRRP